MNLNQLSYQKVKIKYLRYIKSQEVLSEPFRNKINQLNNFYLPISKMINENYLKKKKNSNYRSDWRPGFRKINYCKYFKDNFKRKL